MPAPSHPASDPSSDPAASRAAPPGIRPVAEVAAAARVARRVTLLITFAGMAFGIARLDGGWRIATAAFGVAIFAAGVPLMVVIRKLVPDRAAERALAQARAEGQLDHAIGAAFVRVLPLATATGPGRMRDVREAYGALVIVHANYLAICPVAAARRKGRPDVTVPLPEIVEVVLDRAWNAALGARAYLGLMDGTIHFLTVRDPGRLATALRAAGVTVRDRTDPDAVANPGSERR